MASVSSTRVWIAQCLCPQRHCILAAADEANDENEATRISAWLQRRIAAKLIAGELSPWCGLCRAPVESWRYEVTRTNIKKWTVGSPIQAPLDAIENLRKRRPFEADGRLE